MRVTLNDIAQRVGVSKALVSIYLNNHKLSARIADKTKVKIDLAVKELNYKPSFTARALSRGKTNTIGMVCGEIKNPYFAYLVQDAMEEAAKHDYQLLLSLTRWIPEEEERALENLLDRQIDALISCIDPNPETQAYQMLKNARIPVLCLNYGRDGFTTINANYYPALQEAMRRFAEQGYHSVYGSFYEKSKWPTLFDKACREFQLTPKMLSENQTADDVSELVKTIAPEGRHAFIVNGYLMYAKLKRAFRNFPEYRPDMVVGLDDYSISQGLQYVCGVIYTDTPTLIRNAVNHLITQLEQPDVKLPAPAEINAVYLTSAEVVIRQKQLEEENIIPFPGHYK